MGWWGMGLGWLFLVLLVLGIVVLAVVLVSIFRNGTGRGAGGDAVPQGPQRNRARDIIDERYARGEIDAAEYDEMHRRLDERDG
ncbi:hypothetical protein CETAM_12145 [Corynebacterium comes]|uniref:Uncharacterized protein n=2 Tax=Corynebacterium comes TaxID=2675218 RepID=A0A6B8VZM0_9CORY|nr:hypothetical protein CETAM_12145 [Corynebacterium comes]